MQMLHRRATSGTHLKLRVPSWHIFWVKRAKNPLMRHAFIEKQKNARVPEWHGASSASVIFGKLHVFCKGMINFQFQCCNNSCEVCERKTKPKHIPASYQPIHHPHSRTGNL